MLFSLESLSMSQKSVHLQCVFHSIRFKVNKSWSTAVLLFLCPYASFFLIQPLIPPFHSASIITLYDVIGIILKPRFFLPENGITGILVIFTKK